MPYQRTVLEALAVRIPTLIALVLGLAVPLSAAGERFIDTFEGGSLEPGWTVDAARAPRSRWRTELCGSPRR